MSNRTNRTYILQKELPDGKPGDEYVWNDSQKAYYKNGNVCDSYWMPEYVEVNMDWFKLKEEKAIIEKLQQSKYCPVTYCFRSSKKIDIEKYKDAIQKAIEFIINE